MTNLADYINGPATRYTIGETSVIDTPEGRAYATAMRVVIVRRVEEPSPELRQGLEEYLSERYAHVAVFDE